MTEVTLVIIKCLLAILVGIFAGNGAVYCFNRIPASWLCDYGEKPAEALLDKSTQRIKSTPWKYLFTMAFVVINIKMVMDDWQFAIGAVCVLWLLLEIAIADVKYRIIPDQLVVLLAVGAMGFVPYHSGWKDILGGAAVGFFLMLAVALLGKLAYRRETIGGGDIKLFASLGLILGFSGTLVVIVLTSLISGGAMVYLLATKRVRTKDTFPMAPYILVAVVIYMVFLWGFEQILYI